jgi:hypothetical protein
MMKEIPLRAKTLGVSAGNKFGFLRQRYLQIDENVLKSTGVSLKFMCFLYFSSALRFAYCAVNISYSTKISIVN